MNLKNILRGRLNRLITKSPNADAEKEILRLVQKGDQDTWRKKYNALNGNAPLRNGETVLTQIAHLMKQGENNYIKAWKLYKKTNPSWDYLYKAVSANRSDHIILANTEFLCRLNIARKEWPEKTFETSDVEKMQNEGVSVNHDKKTLEGISAIFKMTAKESIENFKPNAKGVFPSDLYNDYLNNQQSHHIDTDVEKIQDVLNIVKRAFDRAIPAQTFLRWKNNASNQSLFPWLKNYKPTAKEFQKQFGLYLADPKIAAAIQSGDLESYQKMAAANSDIAITEAIFDDGETPLIMALKKSTEKAMHEQLLLRSFIKNREIQSGNIEAVMQWVETYFSIQSEYGDIDQICTVMLQDIDKTRLHNLPENINAETVTDILDTHTQFNANIPEYRKGVFAFVDATMNGKKPAPMDDENSADYVPEMDYSRPFITREPYQLDDAQRKTDNEKREKDAKAQREYELWQLMLQNEKFNTMHKEYLRTIYKQAFRQELQRDREKERTRDCDRGYEMDM